MPLKISLPNEIVNLMINQSRKVYSWYAQRPIISFTSKKEKEIEMSQ